MELIKQSIFILKDKVMGFYLTSAFKGSDNGMEVVEELEVPILMPSNEQLSNEQQAEILHKYICELESYTQAQVQACLDKIQQLRG